MVKIFLTGASGYVGGEVLHELHAAHPDFEYALLLRDKQKAEQVAKAYPKARIVLGDLDSAALLEDEARKADIVVHAASSKHIASAEAISRGLAGKKSHWIQISGASLFSMPDVSNNAYGEPSDKVYSDVDGIDEIRSLINQFSSKRLIDSFFLNLAKSPSSVKTAVVFPPLIYGRGRGPVNQRSVQAPGLSKVALQRREAVQVGKGQSIWSNVHITDISQIFVKLVEKAVRGEDGDLWNENGLYLAENGALTFQELSQLIAQEAYRLGLADSQSVAQLTPEQADELSPLSGLFWGTNAREQAQRARKLFGWSPTGKSLAEEIPATVQVEQERLGLK